MTFKKRVQSKTDKITVSTESLPKVDKRKTMPHLQKPGMPSLNPAGRPKGSRNKLGEVFLRAMLEDFEENGESAIQDCRKDDPATYVRVIASLLPKELNIKNESTVIEKVFAHLTVTEVNDLLIGIREANSGASAGKLGNTKAIRGESSRVH